MPTKLETIYKKIKNEVIEIKTINGYDNNSTAFGHFYIKHVFNIDDQTANEALTDGGFDNGIDAIYISEDPIPILHFFQFKFPNSENNLGDGYTDNEIAKLGNGTQEFLESKELDTSSWNEYLIEKHNVIRELDSYEIKLWIVRYTNAKVTHQEKKLEKIAKRIYRSTLNKCNYIINGAQNIMELYESRFEKIYPTIHLNILSSVQAQQFEGDSFKSINTVCSIKNLYDAVTDNRDKIFDGNVRYYNSKTEVTLGIRKTLIEQPEKFILMNNGITILAEEVSFNLKGPKFTLKSASIINGAQTVGSILEVIDQAEDKEKYNESTVLVRILEIKNEEDVINEIVNSLNTQTKMFSAYNISKDSRLRNIQTEINNSVDTPHFLEIKYNEFNTMKKSRKTEKFKKDVVSSEKLIQLYTAFFNLKSKASLAKSNSSELLKDDELINNALDRITKEDAIKILDLYKDIQSVITDYRIYRNTKKNNILEFLRIDEKKINDYQFLTTGDILILFATSIVMDLYPDKSKDEAIKFSINESAKYIKKLTRGEKVAFSNITKSKTTFEGLKDELYKNKKK